MTQQNERDVDAIHIRLGEDGALYRSDTYADGKPRAVKLAWVVACAKTRTVIEDLETGGRVIPLDELMALLPEPRALADALVRIEELEMHLYGLASNVEECMQCGGHFGYSYIAEFDPRDNRVVCKECRMEATFPPAWPLLIRVGQKRWDADGKWNPDWKTWYSVDTEEAYTHEIPLETLIEEARAGTYIMNDDTDRELTLRDLEHMAQEQ